MADSKGFAPIICRITIDGKDAEFSVSQKVHIEDWDVEMKKAIRSWSVAVKFTECLVK